MNQRAVPDYLKQQDFSDTPPGHQFGLFFDHWGKDGGKDWELLKENRATTLKKIGELSETARQLLSALQQRQRAVMDGLGGAVCVLHTCTTTPFLTGIGQEHPLENGFAFLNPYGLPYLPGAGVKGVLRRAAEELALGYYDDDPQGWNIVKVWWLFGFEPSSVYLTGPATKAVPLLKEEAQHWQAAYQHTIEQVAVDTTLPLWLAIVLSVRERQVYQNEPRQFLQRLADDKTFREQIRNRGALTCWDVFPQPANNHLVVDILNPHHKDYYEGSTTPHDAEDPTPVFFLTLPPGSRFTFYVQCDITRLPALLHQTWHDLLSVAFQHAFTWLGFGAKTAVGYGQLVGTEAPFHPWVEATLASIQRQHHCQLEEALRSLALAQAWQSLTDPLLKQAVLEDIKTQWHARGWWDKPSGQKAKEAFKLYQGVGP